MREYSNLVDLIGLELSSTETRCKVIVKKFERSQTMWAERIKLKETLAKFQPVIGNDTSTDRWSKYVTLKAAERKRRSDASPMEFNRRSLAAGSACDFLPDLLK